MWAGRNAGGRSDVRRKLHLHPGNDSLRVHSLAYDEAAFLAVIEKYGIHHNGVFALIQSAY